MDRSQRLRIDWALGHDSRTSILTRVTDRRDQLRPGAPNERRHHMLRAVAALNLYQPLLHAHRLPRWTGRHVGPAQQAMQI